ncbi:MAG: RdgB/HAM1 family non-canonical purine NTP pyrophosphatase [Phycisphaera sp.]|nr:MAG: RdgB/HAM1 family non-canonical purine NTP pyrophosphatase [Phycisphaera sp.]
MGPYGVVTIATGNPGKVAELRPIFAGLGIGVVGLADLATPTTEPEETGNTFEANATIKAISYAKQTGTVCLADDSGLEVDALGGAPGVISSHYSTDGNEDGRPRAQRDAANNERLLRELAGVPAEQRTARFVCVMVLANPDGEILATSRGTFEGRIGTEPRGESGFGYDPLFLVAPGHARTSAEMAADEKNAISHRAKAAHEMAQAIAGLPR